jgi:hypothetical protein
MKLVEFFNKAIEVGKNTKDHDTDKISDDLFWFILDHDKLHKDYFLPIAQKLKKLKEVEPEVIKELYMPMVIKGCKEFYHDKDMKGKLGKEFPKELRDEMCHRLHDHYFDDVQNDEYKLGK